MLVYFSSGVHRIPDPVLNDDGHFKSFDEVYGSITTENDCPSVAKSKAKKSLQFNATQQHVKNVNTLIQCEECNMWRLLFSKKKLNPNSIVRLENILSDITYTCGATFDDLDLPSELQSVCIKVHQCTDPIEKLYFSCGFSTICYYCAKDLMEDCNVVSSEHYPMCASCLGEAGKSPVRKPIRCKK